MVQMDRVSLPLIIGFRPKHPRVSPLEADAGILEIKQRQAQAVDAARRSLPHPVIDNEPSLFGVDRRGTESNLIGIPPTTTPSLQHEALIAQYVRSGGDDNHMCAPSVVTGQWMHAAI
jgi:predicted metal-dependent phosphoesterase TrpH